MNNPLITSILVFGATITATESFAQNSSSLFTLLSPKQTNITFNNELKDTKEHNIMIYSNFYGGAGVGVGDINNDGLPDIYFAGNQVGDQLYLNKGNMVFENITKKSGITDNGGWSSGVLFGDVNQDGFVDIYVTRELYDDDPELRKNKLYINNGDLTFSEESEKYGVADDGRTRSATFLDYDKDGDLDLFLLNQPPNPGDYSKFYNTDLSLPEYAPRFYEYHNGRYTDVTARAGLGKTGFPNSVAACDINGDGWTDLFVSNDFQIGDWLYINNGDGTFTDKILDYARHTSYFSMGVDAGDINNDGKPDLIVADMVAEDNYRLKANMSGMDPDAFWKVVADGEGYQYMFNMLHLNIGEGYLSDIAQLAGVASTDWSWSPLFADLDNDGWKDLFISNGLLRDIRNKDAAKKFDDYVEKSLYEYIQQNPNPGNVSIWDVVDINKTLKIVPSVKLHNYVYKNNGDLTFSKKVEEWGFPHETFSHGAAYADLDNDGDIDLIVNNMNDPAYIYENHSANRKNRHYLRVQPVAQSKKVSIHGVKVWVKTSQGEQFYELAGARGMYSTSEMIAHFGLGSATMVEQVKVRWPDGREQVLKNVPANQLIEARYEEAVAPSEQKRAPEALMTNITSETSPDIRHQENEFDDYRMQVLMPHKMSTLGPALACADLNGDELEDFFLGGAATEPGRIFLQKTDGAFENLPSECFIADKIREDVDAAFLDVDLDGDLDLYVVSGGNEFNPQSKSYQDRLYINDGQGHFSKAEDLLPEMIMSGSKVRPEDFDQDGDLDLLVTGRHIPWAYPEPASSVLLLNNNGRFEDVTAATAPDLTQIGMVNDAVWFDYNNDGLKDLLLVGEWMAPTILENDGASFKKTSGGRDLDDSKGWWFSVAAADLDGDGDQDFIAGNLGLNYKYKATESEPFEVYYYDFDENGSKDVVLTYYNFGIKYPLRGRQCSSEQVPMLKEKFPTYDLFASSDVGKVYGEDKLENALHREATTFASTWFENLGDGRFESHPLPTLAQLSSVNALIVDDFTQDGHLDILIAGNLYAAEVETTRNDAGFGLLLSGDGQGDFTPATPAESGFFVPYDVKSMRPLQSHNTRLLLVGCNNDRLQIFKVNDWPSR